MQQRLVAMHVEAKVVPCRPWRFACGRLRNDRGWLSPLSVEVRQPRYSEMSATAPSGFMLGTICGRDDYEPFEA